MNSRVESFLIVVVKQAIIGASTTVIAVWQLGAIVSREALVWGPKLLAWANSPTE